MKTTTEATMKTCTTAGKAECQWGDVLNAPTVEPWI